MGFGGPLLSGCLDLSRRCGCCACASGRRVCSLSWAFPRCPRFGPAQLIVRTSRKMVRGDIVFSYEERRGVARRVAWAADEASPCWGNRCRFRYSQLLRYTWASDLGCFAREDAFHFDPKDLNEETQGP